MPTSQSATCVRAMTHVARPSSNRVVDRTSPARDAGALCRRARPFPEARTGDDALAARCSPRPNGPSRVRLDWIAVLPRSPRTLALAETRNVAVHSALVLVATSTRRRHELTRRRDKSFALVERASRNQFAVRRNVFVSSSNTTPPGSYFISVFEATHVGGREVIFWGFFFSVAARSPPEVSGISRDDDWFSARLTDQSERRADRSPKNKKPQAAGVVSSKIRGLQCARLDRSVIGADRDSSRRRKSLATEFTVASAE